MKKAALLILLPSFISAMQAPRGVTMDRATDCLKQGAQQAGRATADCLDQAICCGCCENKMRGYLNAHDENTECDDYFGGNKTAYGCLCYTYCNSTDDHLCDPLICGGSTCVFGGNICYAFAELAPLPTLTSTALSIPAFCLFKRRFDKVKVEFEQEQHKNQ